MHAITCPSSYVIANTESDFLSSLRCESAIEMPPPDWLPLIVDAKDIVLASEHEVDSNWLQGTGSCELGPTILGFTSLAGSGT